MPTASQSPRDSSVRRHRKRRTHQRTDSNGELLSTRQRSSYHEASDRRRRRDIESDEDEYAQRRERSPGTPSKQRPRRRGESRHAPAAPEYARTKSTALSSDQLARLDDLNHRLDREAYEFPARESRRRAESRQRYDDDEREARERERRREERRRKRKEQRRAAELATAGDAGAEYAAARVRENAEELVYKKSRQKRRDTARVPSGQALERGDEGLDESYYSEKEPIWSSTKRKGWEWGSGGGGGSNNSDGSGSSEFDPEAEERKKKLRKRIFIGAGILLLILAIVIPVAVVVSKKDHGNNSSNTDDSGPSTPNNSNLDNISKSSIPQQYQGTYLDPFTWYDTEDFNVTFTSDMIGNLSIMGLNSTWDDSVRANDNVKALDESWEYGTDLVRGINIGGWLSIEPFITPSLFTQFSSHDGVVDEWTLSKTLGPSKAASTIEKHYSSWVTRQTFADIQAAGFDHVRIPFSYWAVTTYEGDPYVPKISWRYLLRAIEWAREHGLRINLDLHGAPGSQNGWNHSGRQGLIRWLNGTDGTLNGQRTIDVHNQLSTFFSQPRYKNVITMYGLVNEPRMVELDVQTVLDWSKEAINTIRGNNYTGVIIFGDGFLGLDHWQGKLQGIPNLLLDVHQYVIFNVEQIVLNHHDKINFACGGWTAQALRSENTATGFGPTLCGEWSQADTDCAMYLNDVGVGSRWEGTLNMASTPGGSMDGSILTPTCPTKNNPRCDCQPTQADPSTYSAEYKQWLLMFAEAQMHSFEQGWGWFYWTWKTESTTQWSYQDGLANGIQPKLAYQRDFNCSQDIPDFASLGLPEYY